MIEELQTFSSKGNRAGKSGPRRLNADEINRVWDEVQAKSRAGLGWRPPNPASPAKCQNSTIGCTQS